MPRPRTLAELANVATTDSYDPSRSLKDQLRAAEQLRKDAKAYARQGQLEPAFVNAARAANIILDKMPSHPQYFSLKKEYKDALKGNGQDLLNLLEDLKPRIHNAYERWSASGAPDDGDLYVIDQEEYEQDQREEERSRRERRLAAADEAMRLQEEDAYRRRDTEDRERNFRQKQMEREREISLEDAARIARERAKAERQRQAEEYHRASRRRDEEIRAQRRNKEDHDHSYSNGPPHSLVTVDYADYDRGREPAERQGTYPQLPSAINYPASSSGIPYVTPPQRDDLGFSSPGPLPLESPHYVQYAEPEDTYRPINGSRNTPRRPSYPPPVTTTSPTPAHIAIEYPKLMTAHQLQQGYRPSAHSMFMDSNLFFDGSVQNQNRSPQSFPKPPFIPPSSQSPIPYGTNYPTLPSPTIAYPYNGQGSHQSQRVPYGTPPKHSNPYDTAPPRPPKVPFTPPNRQSSAPTNGDGSPVEGDLRTVWLPEETLHRFMQIAAINTERKLETCGLLLGRKRSNGSYTVQTLLVPRQTSDENSCTMTNEEMVIDFQEKRGLVTLGWIHTHPTQSCFMSSLDLHTHSGYQQVLPEAFAIVCAPKSNPSFGIFRLTDPPGLQIIMGCDDQRSFHPHPDEPIYTDADSGHVRMADIPLEIADLRASAF